MIVCLLLALAAGCGSQAQRAGIQSLEPGERIRAIRSAGEARDAAAVPLLIDRLDDEDEAVRFFAILALERITGTRMGYDYRMWGAARVAAIERWRDALHSGQVGSRAAAAAPGVASDPVRDGAHSSVESSGR
ncbi:MAG: HEAT repeat domain-containing protein [Phycisphaerae bacterium]